MKVCDLYDLWLIVRECVIQECGSLLVVNKITRRWQQQVAALGTNASVATAVVSAYRKVTQRAYSLKPNFKATLKGCNGIRQEQRKGCLRKPQPADDVLIWG